jgi:hypothetical protein
MIKGEEQKIECLALMKRLHKKENPEDLRNWRSVNAIDCDHCLLSENLVDRLKKVLPEI